MSDEDLLLMQKSFGQRVQKSDALLVICEDGRVYFECGNAHFEGRMPDERGFGETVTINNLESETELRSFDMSRRAGELQEAPTKITFFSEGLPATNEPSKQSPITAYLTKTDREIPGKYDQPEETKDMGETQVPEGKVICPGCKSIVERARFCSECGAPLSGE